MKTTLQHGIIENSMKTAQQRNCTQLDFNPYLDLSNQKKYTRAIVYQSNVQP